MHLSNEGRQADSSPSEIIGFKTEPSFASAIRQHLRINNCLDDEAEDIGTILCCTVVYDHKVKVKVNVGLCSALS